MKKLILSAAFLAFAGIASVKANETNSLQAITVQQDSTTKTPVKIEDLPDAVKATLASEKYKDWAPLAAYLVTDDKKTEYYQVDVKKAEETASLKIGKDGVVVE